MRRYLVPLVALALVAGCGGDDGPSKDEPLADTDAALFEHDESADLELTEGETVDRPRYVIKGMSYASPGGDRVSGIVVSPKPARPQTAGVIFMHGSGGTRADFLPDAAKLAERGAVAMTIDSPFTRSTDEAVQAGFEDRPTTRKLMIQNVKDLVRGLDVLVERYDVDPARVAIVGYSMGAQPAVLAAAADPRVRALVVMAGRAKPSGPVGDPEVDRLFVPLNTERFIGHVAPARILLQGGRRDAIIPRSEMETLFARASEPKEIRWYDAGHELGTKADADRIRWLSAALGLR